MVAVGGGGPELSFSATSAAGASSAASSALAPSAVSAGASSAPKQKQLLKRNLVQAGIQALDSFKNEDLSRS